MENDLISRAAAIESLGECPYNWNDWPEEIQAVDDWESHKKALEDLPAVDAEPIVRCKDCHYWHQELDEVHHWYCTYGWAHQTTPDHYCADGKRRDGE